MIQDIKIFYSFSYLKPKKRKESLDYVEDNVFVDIPEYHKIPDILYINEGYAGMLNNYKYIDGHFYKPHCFYDAERKTIEVNNKEYTIGQPSIQNFIENGLQNLLKEINHYNGYGDINILKDIPIHRKKISDNLLEVEQYVKNMISNNFCLIDGVLYEKTNEPKLSFRNCLFWNYSMGNHIITNKNSFYNSYEMFDFEIVNYNLLKHIANEITKTNIDETFYNASPVSNLVTPYKIIYLGNEIIIPNKNLLNTSYETQQDIYNKFISFFKRYLFAFSQEDDFLQFKEAFNNAENNGIDGFHLILNTLNDLKKYIPSMENNKNFDTSYQNQLLINIEKTSSIINAIINGINNYQNDIEKNNLTKIDPIVVSMETLFKNNQNQISI